MRSENKHIAILCNPLASSGRAVALADKVVSALSGKQISYSVFKENWPSSFEGFTDAWIIGGDGTLNYFINHYPEIKLPLVVFKGGTGNDFQWLLYGNMSFEEQLQLTLTAEPRPVDIGKCNEKYFINGAGIGFEGEVARGLTGKKKRPGKASFMAMILKKIFSYRSASYHITADGQRLDAKKYLIIDASNGCRAGGGFHIAPEAKADDGLLDLILVDAISPLSRLRWLPLIEKGKHLNLSFIKHMRVKKAVIESNSLIQYHLDGEYYEASELNIETLSGKLLFRY